MGAEAPSPAVLYARRSLMSGIAALALPLSGIGIMAFMMFVLSSDYLYNQLSGIARIYSGLALLSPVPLAVAALVFFLRWVVAGEKRSVRPGRGAAVAGLVLACLSLVTFALAVVLLPDL